MNKCHMCKLKKTADNFYKDSTRKSGVGSRCKSCARLMSRIRYPEDKTTEQYKTRHVKNSRLYVEKYPDRQKARLLAKKANLKKEACEQCGLKDTLHMHHPDYSQPLNVITLCVSCHEIVHHGVGVMA